MIDLHLHLDGSIPVEDIIEIAKKNNIKLPSYEFDKIDSLTSVDINCKSLNEYLRCFEIPLRILQRSSSIEDVVYSLVKRLYNQGLIYAEIRFAPQLSTIKGLSQKEVVESACKGLKKGINEIRDNGGFFNGGLILCCMRGKLIEKQNVKTIEICKEYLGKGVVGLDLAGAEAIFKTRRFGNLFKLARELDIPFTIHAGEADGVQSIKKAIEFGAKRIGHGVKAINDIKLINEIIEKNIVLEMCPISNVQTKAVDKIENHPIKKMLDMGVRVCVNTDNMTVSKTTIENEYNLLEKVFNITKEDKKKMLENSIYGAFITEEEKEELRKEVEKRL